MPVWTLFQTRSSLLEAHCGLQAQCYGNYEDNNAAVDIYKGSSPLKKSKVSAGDLPTVHSSQLDTKTNTSLFLNPRKKQHSTALLDPTATLPLVLADFALTAFDVDNRGNAVNRRYIYALYRGNLGFACIVTSRPSNDAGSSLDCRYNEYCSTATLNSTVCTTPFVNKPRSFAKGGKDKVLCRLCSDANCQDFVYFLNRDSGCAVPSGDTNAVALECISN